MLRCDPNLVLKAFGAKARRTGEGETTLTVISNRTRAAHAA